jgi:hypothetical protein
MRTAFLLLTLLLSGAPAVAAQTSFAAVPMDSRLIPAPAAAAAPSAALRRDHLAGAVQGAALGAVVGGLGFAAVTYLGNEGDAGYAVLALPVGAVVGGAVGLVAGAIIGAPDRQRDEEPQAQLLVSRGAARGITAAVSVPLRPR